MQKINLSLGFYEERPWGKWAGGMEADKFRKRYFDFMSSFLEILDKEEVPRTLFILGDYLNNFIGDAGENAVKELYATNNKLNDIQQHSYSHDIIRKIEIRPEKEIVSEDVFADDIARGHFTLKWGLGINCNGIGVPLGYDSDLGNHARVLSQIRHLGYNFVSPNLRSKESLEAHLTAERQPHTYSDADYPNLVEIPPHGWQDVIFTKKKAEHQLNGRLHTPDEIISHYTGLFEKASKMKQDTAYVSLCLHPWAMMEYDPQHDIWKTIIGNARKQGIELVTYSDIANKVLRQE